MDCDSERIWKIAESHRLNVPKRKNRPQGSSVSLFDRLYDCYVECISDKSSDKRFRSAVNLLQRVAPEHARVSLIVSLYSDEKGYSLMLTPPEDGKGEEIFLPYEDNEIFSYLDNHQIPPVLLEVIEKTKHCHLYHGCVVCEVRDYRNPPSAGLYDKHLILLRPTSESITATVNEIAQETKCSPEERLFLESQLLLATQPPICLDPSTDVVCVTNRLQYNRRKFHTHSMRRYLRRRSQAYRARMYMRSEQPAPSELRLFDFVSQNRTATLHRQQRDSSNSWKRPRLDLAQPCNPEEIFKEVTKYADTVAAQISGDAQQAAGATVDRQQEQALAPSLPVLPPTAQLQYGAHPEARESRVTQTPTSVADRNFANELLMSGQTKPNQPQLSHPPTHAPMRTIKTEPSPYVPLPPTPPAASQAIVQTLPPSMGQPTPAQAQAAIAQQLSLSRGLFGLLPNNPAILDLIRTGRLNRPIAPRPGLPMSHGAGVSTQTPAMVQLLKMAEVVAARRNVPGGVSATATSSQVPVGAPGRSQAGFVVVSRHGQPSLPGIVSFQPVSAPRLAQRPVTTPPTLKGPPSSMGTATPTLIAPPKLSPPTLQRSPAAQKASVQASMPKLTPLDPLKQQQPSPTTGRIPSSPAMPQLHKIAASTSVPAPRLSPVPSRFSGNSSQTGPTTSSDSSLAAVLKLMPQLKGSPLLAAKKSSNPHTGQ